MNHYDDLKEKVFYREIENDKVEVKISVPCVSGEVKEIMKKIKD